MVYVGLGPGDSIDKYTITRLIGTGHFGAVYLCHDAFLERDVAIKVIEVPNPDKFVSAVDEGRVLDLCRHRYVVEVYDVRAVRIGGDTLVMIVMEHLERGSVQKYLESGFISCRDATKIVQSALIGLEHAHANGILHRDIKPGNLMVGNSNDAKLSDFGLAIEYAKVPSDLKGYRPHQPLEVINGQPMNKLSDIYAMGVTYSRLVNNVLEIPFPFSSKAEWIEAVRKARYPNLLNKPYVPVKIVRILRTAMHLDPGKRFQDAAKFRFALEKLQFLVDWRLIDSQRWIGTDGTYKYELTRNQKKSGWVIDLKRNGIRRGKFCHSGIATSENAAELFFQILRDTTMVR